MAAVDFTPEQLGALASRGVVLVHARPGPNVGCSVLLEPPVHVFSETSFDFPFSVGAFSHLNGGFIQNVTIGRYCSFARDVQIGHGYHPHTWLSVSPLQYVKGYRRWGEFVARQGVPIVDQVRAFEYARHTTVGNDVWIGNHVFVKDGVTIGDGAIIGAGSVVTRDVPPYMIVGGNPARVIRPRFHESLVERLLSVRWWRYALPALPAMPYEEPAAALDRLAALVQTGTVREYQPEPIRLPDFFVEHAI
jgi:acetyltransferase-like isoleucine patch superfamily enzyme